MTSWIDYIGEGVYITYTRPSAIDSLERYRLGGGDVVGYGLFEYFSIDALPK